MRVIAPEKEVMIGGASLYIWEGFGGSSAKELLTARGGQASAEDPLRGESKRASTCSPGKGGRPGSGQEADSSDSGASFRGEARFFGRYSTLMFSSHGAGRSLWGTKMTHMQTQSGVCLPALTQCD